jgi:hypothetical protein
VSAYEERMDAWLDRVEAAFAPVPDLLAWARSATENSAAALAASQSNGNEIAHARREIKTIEGRLSDLEVKVDAVAGVVTDFRAEFKAGFAELWKHLLPDEPSEAAAVATVHPIRQHDPAE